MSLDHLFTRADYLATSRDEGHTAHRRYYAQFVTPATTEAVVWRIGHAWLMASTDPHLNDIPLRMWGSLRGGLPYNRDRLKAAGDYLTLSGIVCIAKEAARQYIEAQS